MSEQDDWERADLGRGVYFTIKKADDGSDSLCLIETHCHKYLNINDCVAPDTRAFHQGIFNTVGRPDVLFRSQSSHANWLVIPATTQ